MSRQSMSSFKRPQEVAQLMAVARGSYVHCTCGRTLDALATTSPRETDGSQETKKGRKMPENRHLAAGMPPRQKLWRHHQVYMPPKGVIFRWQEATEVLQAVDGCETRLQGRWPMPPFARSASANRRATGDTPHHLAQPHPRCSGVGPVGSAPCCPVPGAAETCGNTPSNSRGCDAGVPRRRR